MLRLFSLLSLIMKKILIHIQGQCLQLLDGDKVIHYYDISSALNGTGSEEGSYKTPLGAFLIDEKHGFKAPRGTIFKARKTAGIWSGEKEDGDLILSRILWLKGLDESNTNTKQRYIYIHGTNHEDKIGVPHSCGCIRMKNTDVIHLYDIVSLGTRVEIR